MHKRWLNIVLLLWLWPVAAMPDLQLVGEGSFRYLFWQLYDARLKTSDGSFDDYQSNAPVLLELTYKRSISRDQFIDATVDQWQHLGQSSEAQQQDWANQLKTIWQDVGRGDRLAALLQPDMTVDFFLNGEAIGRVTDTEFGPLFFDIWLHPDTSAPTLRRQLLAAR
ncbi:chalcone isomerase family protein [Alkalimonas sp. MEB108]|uniref:Chalcone isomerase family protein n=1 Tax=Alkalimonas cellulosilytica TaxID=3058395 RepID=A0ABU7J0V9_9GAMM|nr:chalcone isomerase family protein [Alkalimonas sp. MEB108]MEE1999910.1 chalcone isomerase family protein [Alkalimonas sp. MEB108]